MLRKETKNEDDDDDDNHEDDDDDDVKNEESDDEMAESRTEQDTLPDFQHKFEQQLRQPARNLKVKDLVIAFDPASIYGRRSAFLKGLLITVSRLLIFHGFIK